MFATRKHRPRVVASAFACITVSLLVVTTSCSSSSTPKPSDNHLTIMTNSGSWAGFGESSLKSANSVNSFYKRFHDIWVKKYPTLSITEETVRDMPEATSKTLLAVTSKNPADLIPIGSDLGALVQRGALTNLDAYFKKAGITADDFLPGLAASAQVNGHWYAIPGASDPSTGDLLYMPAAAKAAGLDPVNPPKTWDELYTATVKATKFDSAGNIVRAGYQLNYAPTQLSDVVNLYCGSWTTYNQTTGKFNANAPCIKNYFTFQKKVLDFYGGIGKWSKFFQGDPYVYDCSDADYLEQGKTIFTIDAWWVGSQLDSCKNYKNEWRLAPAPAAPSGSPYGSNAVRTMAWMVGIPQGAANPDVAFNFAKLILWDNGRLLGPTTNGAVLKSELQPWADNLVKISNAERTKNGAVGQPMKSAMDLVVTEATKSGVGTPVSPYTNYYNSLLDSAWQQIQFGKASVSGSLDSAQKLIEQREASGN